MKVVLLICSLLSLAWGKKDGGPCTQNGPFDFRKDPDDCTGFYRCANSVFSWTKCPPGTVFSVSVKTCVHRGGPRDKCIPTVVVEKNPVCSGTSDRLIPHTGSCAQYYDCEAPSLWRWEKNLHECPYPEVFNTENRKCEHYTMVDCGDRHLPIGQCEYKANRCLMSHCIPCDVRYPSCRDKEDGFHPYTYSPVRFIVCVDQRFVYKADCYQGAGIQHFDEELKTCVSGPPEY